MPKVSVIVPNYNYRRFLTKRIDSILAQTYQDIEIILLDDCSTDGSQELLKQYSKYPTFVKYLVNAKNSGSPFAQWERGMAFARGEYLWIAESDDYCKNNFLEVMVNALNDHPTASFAASGSLLVDENDRILSKDYDCWDEDGSIHLYNSESYIKQKLLWHDTVYNASMVLFRRTAYEKICHDFARMHYCADWLFWIAMALQGDIVEVRRKLNCFRQHPERVTVRCDGTKGQLQEKIMIASFLWQLSFISKYKVHLAKGAFYKEIKRLHTTREQRKEYLHIINEELGIKKTDYILERTVKILNQLFPWIVPPINK